MSFNAFDGSDEPHTLDKAFGRLFDDQATSDFRIFTTEGTIHVHKSILASRSDYFRTLFSNGRFKENEQEHNMIDLSDDNLHASLSPSLTPEESHCVVEALLKALYTDGYPIEISDKVFQGGPQSDGIASLSAQVLRYHASVSVLANRFLVKGVDTIIARQLDRYVDFTQALISDKTRHHFSLRTDEDFFEAIHIVYSNALRSESTGAVHTIAALLVDYMHQIKDKASFKQFSERTPALMQGLLHELTHGKVRMICPDCNEVSRITSEALREKSVHDEETCSNCNTDFEYAEGLRQWYVEAGR